MNYQDMLPTIDMDTYTPPSTEADDKLDPLTRKLSEQGKQQKEAEIAMMQQLQQQAEDGLARMRVPGAMTFLPS